MRQPTQLLTKSTLRVKGKKNIMCLVMYESQKKGSAGLCSQRQKMFTYFMPEYEKLKGVKALYAPSLFGNSAG